MYSESELDAAVQARLMTPATAAHFRTFVAKSREASAADEEYVRLLSSFNDVFVTAALLLALVGTGALLRQLFATPLIAFFAVAALAWLGAEYFTIRRKLALPSFVLFLAFAAGVLGAVFWGLAPAFAPGMTDLDQLRSRPTEPLWMLATAAGLWAGSSAYWYRFRLPVAVAAGAIGAGAGVLLLLQMAAPMAMLLHPYAGPMIVGLAMFGFAMWWDMSDVYRQTRRSDVAFWLHLLAAALIVHSAFGILGVSPSSDDVGGGGAAVTILLYLFFCLVALAIDRRAILVSSLVYVLAAFSTTLSWGVGSAPLAMTVSAIVLGSGLLTLSVWWGRLRRALLNRLPAGLRAQLPRADLEIAAARPVA